MMLAFFISIKPASADTLELCSISWNIFRYQSDSIAIVFFGGYGSGDSLTSYEPYSWDSNTAPAEYAFIDGLVNNGIDVITPSESVTYTTSYNSWLSNVAMILRLYLGYDNVFLFGHSAGGLIVAYEIQKEYASNYYDAAVIASAPVDYYLSPFFTTAQNAQNTGIPTSFICSPNDNIFGNLSSQMQTYYDNMPFGIGKDWHLYWGDPDETIESPNWPAHDVFPDTCQSHSGETITDVACNWYWTYS